MFAASWSKEYSAQLLQFLSERELLLAVLVALVCDLEIRLQPTVVAHRDPTQNPAAEHGRAEEDVPGLEGRARLDEGDGALGHLRGPHDQM